MHEMTLIRAEIQDLRQATEMVSRCHGAKGSQLQTGEAMVVDEGRQVIDRLDVGVQVECESTRSGSRGGSAQAKERGCGGCGKTKHNARICQVIVAVSEEEHSD
jgi:hypothetical protein